MDRREFIEAISLLCGINLLPKELREYSVSRISPESSSSGPYCSCSSCCSSQSSASFSYSSYDKT